MAFSYDIKQKEDVVLLSLKGFVLDEFQLEDLYKKSDDYFDKGLRFFVVDLAEITHMNSSGLNLLIRLLTKCRNNNGDLLICNVPKKVENLLIVSKLTSILETESSLEAAFDKLTKKVIVK